MNKLMRFLKNNIAIGILTLLVATASCSFINNDIDPGDKDKEELLIELVNHVLSRNHYSPADLTDKFSQDVFKNFVYELDPAKRYFLASDYEEFKHITAATTRPICVLSKRKIPAHLRTDPSALAALKSGRKRPRSSSLSSTSSSNHYHQSDQKSDPRIYSKLDQLVGVVESLQTIILQQENAISELVGSVQELKTEVEALGGKPKSSIDLSILTTAGRRQKRNLSAMSDGSILRPETPNFGIPVNSADITGMSPSGGPTASPLWGNDDRSPRARGAPGGVKRLKSEDMLFNFGVPGGTNSPFAVERLGSPGTFLKNE